MSNIFANISVPDAGLTYTATEDCFIAGSILTKSDGTNYVTVGIRINNIGIFENSSRSQYETSNGFSPIAIKSGDIVTITFAHSVGYTGGVGKIVLRKYA